MKKIGIFPFLVSLIWNIGCTQIPTERPHLGSVAFDKKLQELLRFSIPLIGVEELRKIQKEVYIFDTREWREYAVSHVAGARYVGYKDFDAKRLTYVPKDARIVLYCSVGYRSEKIGDKLRQLGYEKVYNLYGSIFEWVNAGYPVMNEKGEQVAKVHTYNRKWSQWVQDKAAQKVW